MTTEELAELMAECFNELEDSPRPYQAVSSDDISEAHAERNDLQVFVIPYGESEEAFDRGDACREELTCSVVVNGPVTREEGVELSRFLRYGLRETELGGYRWQDNETVSLWDSEALRKGQFLGLFRATYFDYA